MRIYFTPDDFDSVERELKIKELKEMLKEENKKLMYKNSDIISRLFLIIEELDARNCSNNCIYTELCSKSWIELCDEAIELFKKLK